MNTPRSHGSGLIFEVKKMTTDAVKQHFVILGYVSTIDP